MECTLQHECCARGRGGEGDAAAGQLALAPGLHRHALPVPAQHHLHTVCSTMYSLGHETQRRIRHRRLQLIARQHTLLSAAGTEARACPQRT